jgi:hypothetical protein
LQIRITDRFFGFGTEVWLNTFWDSIIPILFRMWPDRDRKKLVDYEWADRRQEERAGIYFDRKEEGKREEEMGSIKKRGEQGWGK